MSVAASSSLRQQMDGTSDSPKLGARNQTQNIIVTEIVLFRMALDAGMCLNGPNTKKSRKKRFSFWVGGFALDCVATVERNRSPFQEALKISRWRRGPKSWKDVPRRWEDVLTEIGSWTPRAPHKT